MWLGVCRGGVFGFCGRRRVVDGAELVNSCPIVKVHPAVSNEHNPLGIHRSLRRRAVGVTLSTTGLFASGLHCAGNRPMGIMVTSAAVNEITRTTTYRSGFGGTNMSVALAIAPY